MKNSWIVYTIIVIIILLFTGGLFWWSLQPEIKMITELKIEDVVVGTGAEAKSGDTVTVNYLGTLLDGTKFDSSYDRNQPFSFVLGTGQVIVGWDKGLLAYGSRGAGGVIGPNEPLIFEIELLKL